MADCEHCAALRAEVASLTIDLQHAYGEVNFQTDKVTIHGEAVTRLTAENEKLRAALKPFADESLWSGPHHEFVTVKRSDCDRARAALSASQPAPSQLDDAVNYGIGITLDDKRIDPNDFYLTAPPPWRPIETAPTDGTVVLVFAEDRQGLPAFQCTAAYHEDAGWCVDELRETTHWTPLPPPPQKEGE